MLYRILLCVIVKGVKMKKKEDLIEEISEAILTKIVDILDYYLWKIVLETDERPMEILEEILKQITKEKILARIEQEREEWDVI